MSACAWPRAVSAAITFALLGCGGRESEPGEAPAATPVAAADSAPPPAAPPDTAQAPQEVDSTRTLVREVFSYRGAGRDPFRSLLKSGDVRPLLQDLRVTGITYDTRYPARSVAVMRDTTQGKPYPVRVGDELGRMRISEIRRGEVVVTFDDFGVERQVVLPVRKRQEETP